MARTADNASTAERRLVLLAKEFSFILAHTEQSELLALAIVFAILQGGATAHDGGPPRFYFRTIEGLPMFQSPNPFEGAFWRSDPDKDIRVELDVKNSSGRWRGPRQFAGETPRELMVAELRGGDGKLTPVDVRVLALTLRHDIVVAQLQFMNLLEPADIKAQRSAFLPSTELMTPGPVVMTAEQKKVWLRKAKRDHPWRLDEETFREYAEAMSALQKTVCSNPWPVVTMERRLRDKDPDE